MSDARLVGTNPETSETVPVAVNAKGQMIVADVVIQDIPNDINIQGDLTVGGSGAFAGNVEAIGLSSNTDVIAKNHSPALSYLASSADGKDYGYLQYDVNGVITAGIGVDGAASFASEVVAGVRDVNGVLMTSSGTIQGVSSGVSQYSIIGGTGAATFNGDVIVGSRGEKWLIRESNGVAMLVEQTKRGAKEPRISEEEPRMLEEVRDLPRELDLIEAALSEVMGKLKMTPPAGWPVWSESDNS